MDRRKTLKLISALCLLPGFTVLSSCQKPYGNPPLDGLDSETIKKYGQTYLIRYPNDEGINEIMVLMNDKNQAEFELIKQLQQRVKNDFENEEITNLFGWNISKTEARVFAAATIIMSNRKQN